MCLCSETRQARGSAGGVGRAQGRLHAEVEAAQGRRRRAGGGLPRGEVRPRHRRLAARREDAGQRARDGGICCTHLSHWIFVFCFAFFVINDSIKSALFLNY